MVSDIFIDVPNFPKVYNHFRAYRHLQGTASWCFRAQLSLYFKIYATLCYLNNYRNYDAEPATMIHSLLIDQRDAIENSQTY